MLKYGKKITLACLFVFVATVAFGQAATTTAPATTSTDTTKVKGEQTDPGQQYSEADRPEDNYLAKFHAQDVVDKLMKTNLEQIFILNVIRENFKDKYSDWDGDYKKCYDGYKVGVDYYYRRNIIYSRVKLEENKKMIFQFYKKISDTYRERTLELLNLCADNILELTLNANSSSDPNKNKVLFHNKMRLRVAYGQFDDAERQRIDGMYPISIYHYRVAKTYAIRILEEINPKQFRGKFDVEKADNRNRKWDPNKKTTASEYSNLKEDDILPKN